MKHGPQHVAAAELGPEMLPFKDVRVEKLLGLVLFYSGTRHGHAAAAAHGVS
jgi:hypothetical protein